eukprot:SAG31_NODE_6709_length_1916_cov_3.357182_1_plen_73_part_00
MLLSCVQPLDTGKRYNRIFSRLLVSSPEPGTDTSGSVALVQLTQRRVGGMAAPMARTLANFLQVGLIGINWE